MRPLVLSLSGLLALVNVGSSLPFTGSGIKCYFNTTYLKGDAPYPNNDVILKVPLKTCTKFTNITENGTTVVRGGVALSIASGCSTYRPDNITINEYCFCNTDACNTATTTTSLFTVLILLPALLLGPTIF